MTISVVPKAAPPGPCGSKVGKHDDELSLHDVEHIGYGVDAEHVVAEAELADRARAESGTGPGASEVAVSTTSLGSTWTSNVWFGGKPRPMTVVKPSAVIAAGRRDQLRNEMTIAEHGDVTGCAPGGEDQRRLAEPAGERDHHDVHRARLGRSERDLVAPVAGDEEVGRVGAAEIGEDLAGAGADVGDRDRLDRRPDADRDLPEVDRIGVGCERDLERRLVVVVVVVGGGRWPASGRGRGGVVLVVGGGVNDDAPVSVLVAETASLPNSVTVIEPFVVLLLFGAAYRTLTVHVAPGGRNIPPTHEPPPWIVNWPGVAVIESTEIDVRPVLRTVVVSVDVVLAAIVPKLRASTARPGSRRRMNACWSWSSGSDAASSALPAFEIQATHCPLPDNAGIMCIPP